MSETVGTIIAEAGKETLQIILERAIAKYGKTQASLLTPIITQYGPIFAAMTAAEVWAWLELATKGDRFKAYSEIVARLPNQELANEWASINAKMQTANVQNAQNVEWQTSAITTFLKGLVMVATSMVFV